MLEKLHFLHPSGDGKKSEDVVIGNVASRSNSKIAEKELEMD